MKKRIITTVLSLFVFALIIFSVPQVQYSRAAAAPSSFADTAVLDDLQADTSFKLSDYPYSSTASFRMINIVEWCYTEKESLRADFGLYIYVYNPQGIAFKTSSQSNRIQMSVALNDQNLPVFEKFELEYLNMSTGDYNRLFYKFKVKEKAEGKKIAERVKGSSRRYDISGVELVNDKNIVTDSRVGLVYKFSGYAKGYGTEAGNASTLKGTFEERETVSLEVKKTFYRTGLSDKGKDHQNELNSVYFAVPNRLLEQYGKLQKILAEWWEYKTKPIAVTKNADFYNKVKPYVGKSMSTNQFNKEAKYSLVYDIFSGGLYPGAKWAWNTFQGYYVEDPAEFLYYLFKVNDIKFDTKTGQVIAGEISSAELESYIKSYKGSGEKLPVKDISADLFESTVDSDRKRGYNILEFDADTNMHEMLSYNGTHSWWDKWSDFGFWNTITGKFDDYLNESHAKMPPILAIEDKDITGTDSEISKRLLINEKDVQAFKDYRAAANKENKTTFLFRFAATDYFSGMATIIEPTDSWLIGDIHIENQAYLAQETVFLNFDILQLTFYRDGVYTVIPVVSNPIDIVNSVTPPIVTTPTPGKSDNPNWWDELIAWLKDFFNKHKTVIIIVLIVIAALIVLGLLAFFFPAIKAILKFLGVILALPFIILFLPFKGIIVLIKRKRSKS